ncbi:MAG: hypothetical protein WDA03_06845, partial [Trueperaceae bacterium]
LLHAGVVALAAAALSMFLPLGLPLRAVFTLVAAVLGAAWPLRRGEAAALAAIRAQTGLSYETALGVLGRRSEGAPPGGPGAAASDPYGLERAVVERAGQSVRGYSSPPRPAWWLPALVVAASLVVLPEFMTTPASAAARAGPTAPAGGASDAPAADGAAEPGAPEPPSPGRAEQPALDPARDEEGGDSPVTDLPEGDADGQAPLARYLQSLRERPAAAGAPTDGAAAEDAPDSEPRDPSGDPDDREGRQGSNGEATDRDPTGAADDQAEAPSSGDDGSEPAQEDGTEAAEGDGAADGAEEEAEVGVQPASDQPGQAGAGEGDSGDQQSIDSGTGEAGSGDEGSENAGAGGAMSDEELQDPLGSSGQQEQLPGVLRDGPETVAGSVRLPGSDDVDLPQGTSLAPYQSAAEEALTEGDLPLDYLEIIRRYFR